MRLRVITPTLGESAFWPECVASVNHAACFAEHVIVGPLSSWPSSASRARHINQQGTGLYPALNQGAGDSNTDCESFTWLNDDDRLVAPGFGSLIEAMTRDPNADVCYGRVELIDSRSLRIGELPVCRSPSDLPALLALGIVPFAQPGTVIRREVWDRLEGFDDSYQLAGDLDFFVRALKVGAKFTFVDATVASFRLRAGQLSKRRGEVAAETARALAPLADAKSSWVARSRFRLSNLGIYFDRVRRHGFVSMRQLYDRAT